MKKQWTEYMRKSMADYEVKPPEHLLDDIMAEMQHRTAATPSPSPRRHRRRGIITLAMASAAAVIAVIFLMPWHQPTDSGQRRHAVSTYAVQRQTTVQPADKLLAASAGISSTMQKDVITVRAIDAPDATDSTSSDINADMPADTPADASVQQTTGSGDAKPQKEDSRHPFADNANHYDGVYAHTSSSHSSLLLATYVSGMSSSSTGAQGIMLPMANPIGPYRDTFAYGENTVSNESASPVSTAVRHSEPLKIGFSVSYPLSQRWSIGTGITYSRLASDIEYTSNTSSYTTHQVLHYAGIPLFTTYSIVSNKRFNLYLTGGTEIQKLVKGSADTPASTDRAKESTNVSESKLQFAVNGAFGAEYFIVPAVSLYIEPGVSFFPDNGSQTVNLYKDRPTTFNLNLGLRLNLGKSVK